MEPARLEILEPDLIYRWSAFSPAHRVELTSHAIRTPHGLFVFDPIRLADQDLPQLLDAGPPTAIVITNENHERDTDHWRRQLAVPAWISPLAQVSLPDLHRFPLDAKSWHGWHLQPLEGGAPGEIAFRHPDLNLAILGDAIVNLPGRGLEMLPAKYCTDPSRLANDLLQWCAVPFDRLLVAHGNPLGTLASEQIRQQATHP